MVWRWWNWRPAGLGPYETVRAQLMSRTVLVLAALDLPAVPAQLLLPGPRAPVVVPLVFLAVYAATLRILWSGRQQRAAALFVGSCFALLAGVLLPFGGLHGTTPISITGLAIMAALFLDPVPAGWSAALALGMLLATPIVAEAFPVPQAFTGPRMASALAITFATLVAAVATLGGITVDALRAAGEEALIRAQQAETAASYARAATDAKARFLATMSHELRTPLNAIIGYAGLLREEPGAGDADLERVERIGVRLLATVEEVLEIARVDVTGPAREREPVDLRALLDEIILPHGATLALRGPEGPWTVTSDAAVLRKVLANLLADGGDGLAATFDGESELVLASERTAARPGLALAMSHRLVHQLGGDLVADRPGAVALRLPSGGA